MGSEITHQKQHQIKNKMAVRTGGSGEPSNVERLFEVAFGYFVSLSDEVKTW